MSQYSYPDHGINDPDVASIPDQDMPSTEALLAGTMALMTGIAQGRCDSQRALIVEKVITSLSMLSCHPMASAGFKATIANLRVFWTRMLVQGDVPASAGQDETGAGREPLCAGQHRTLWHAAPKTRQ